MTRRARALCLALALGLSGPATAAAQDLERGLELYRQGAYAEAYEVLAPLAREGSGEAQFHVGEMHLRGLGADQDFAAAFENFLEAGRRGHAQAQVNAGSLLAMGLGPEQDLTGAYFWWIVSVVWQDGAHRRQAMAALAESAGLLSAEQRRAAAGAAVGAWRRGAQ